MVFQENGAKFLKKITSGKIILNPKDKVLLALAYAKALKTFHDDNNVYLDVQPRHSKITITDSKIDVEFTVSRTPQQRGEKITVDDLYLESKKKFAAPEIFNCFFTRQIYYASFRSDVFSLGLIFTRFFTGGNKIGFNKTRYSLVKIYGSSDCLIDFRILNFFEANSLEAPLSKFIRKMLSKDAAGRPYILEVIDNLEAILKTPLIAAISPQIFFTCQQSHFFNNSSDSYDADDEDD